MKKAQTMVEYGLILALVVIVAISITAKMNSSVTKVGDQTNSAISGAGANAANNYCTEIGKVRDANTGECK